MKKFIEIGGRLYNLEMLVDVDPIGPQGTKGYNLKFCNGSYVKFEITNPIAGETRKKIIDAFHEFTAVATAIREYLYDRTIQVVPGPYRSVRHEDY